MCGITGFINFSGHNKDFARSGIKRMADTLIHRGPDEEGYYVDDFAALGHRRLSIIDMKTGQQPMGTADGRFQVVFNGEIYNFLDIRAELKRQGHRFRTRSDTEVILYAYAEWGETCVERMSGMFAIAIWDKENRTLFLARDRVGKKPLYYYRDKNRFCFASELKALRAVDLCPADVDPESLDCYFTFGYIPSPRTIYRNVKKLRAAHTLLVTESDLYGSRYWQLSFAEPRKISLAEAAEEFDVLLNDAVKSRLMSEVPLGVFLSGGLDSPLVVSAMAQAMDKPVLTNSIGFDDRQYNELPLAGAVAKHFQTDHHEFFVKPDALDILDKMAWHFDEPFADSSAVPTWYVCKMARENVTVALSGDGGDESFGGYTFRYLPHVMETRLRSIIPVPLRRAIFGSIGAIYPGWARLPKSLRLKTIFENLAVGDAEAFYCDLAWLRQDTREALYSGEFIGSLQGFTPFEAVRPHYAGCDAVDALGRSQYTDIHFYMTDDVLAKVDRMSMAHSLEVRSPLLDHRILEFAARLPADLKLSRHQGKLVLRKSAANRLPQEILKQPKRGFSIPAADWLRKELKPIAEANIFSDNSLISDVLEKKEIKKVWLAHQSGSRDHSVFLWGLLMLGLWERKHYKA